MKPSTILKSAAVMIALAAMPAAAQMKIIAIQARVGGTTYGVAPNEEQIPINTGDRVRVELVGTSIEGGRGVERPVNARFDVSGRGRLDIVQTGSNWVVVNVRNGGDNGLAQLSYTVNGNYDMRGNLQSGRITFDVGDDRGGSRGNGNSYGNSYRGTERWSRARELTRMLYQGILNQNPRGDDRRDDIQRIYDNGSAGIRDVAITLAREAQLDRRSLSQDEAVRILGDLYRDLLGRDQSDRELWDRDRGFRGNIDTLRRYGLERIVDVIVTSEEFHSVNHLSEFDRMSRDRNSRNDRYGNDRYSRYGNDRDRYDRRPPQR
jgi:hypothetical protein